MKLSNETKTILKNFADINQNIFIPAGDTIKTRTPKTASMYAIANVQEQFPQDFSVYELSKFLNMFSLFEEPDIDFHESHCIISKEKSHARYVYTSPDLIDSMTDYSKEIAIESIDLQFEINQESFKKLMTASKTFGAENLRLRSVNDENKVELSATTPGMKQDNSNEYKLELNCPEVFANDVDISIPLSNMIFVTGDYTVKVTIKELGPNQKIGVCQFINTSLEQSELTYVASAKLAEDV